MYGYALSQNYRSSFVEYALREGSAAAEGAAASLAPTGGAGNSIGAAAAVMGGANEAFDLGIFADPFAPMGATLLPTTTDTDTKPGACASPWTSPVLSPALQRDLTRPLFFLPLRVCGW